jgi:tRNA pseudouridine55 synthase
VDGIFNIDKPAGKTSYGVVAFVKRLTGEKRVGHAGTLDPDATGVLPVCLGKATRVVEYLTGATKTYRAVIELGAATDTYDAAGKVTQRGDASGITKEQLEAALNAFRGAISQTPPMYSALKHHGQPLYKLARAGVGVVRKPRAVTVHRLEVIDWQPPAITVEIECSKGTYVRSLAHDLGQVLGCGAFLKSLRRTRCGIFAIDDAVGLAELEAAHQKGDLAPYLQPIDSVLGDYSSVFIDADAEKAMKQGNTLVLEADTKDASAARLCRAYAPDGRFLGLLRYVPESGRWQPEKVFI